MAWPINRYAEYVRPDGFAKLPGDEPIGRQPMTLEEFLRAAGGHGPCAGLLLTPAPSTPPDGVEFRSVDAQHITNLDALFDVFAEAWSFPARFANNHSRDAFDDWMRDLDNLTNPSLTDPPARGYLTELRNAHLFLPNQDEIFAWFANAMLFYREYYRDGVEPPASFGLLLSAPANRLVEVQNRWLHAGVQITTVAVFDTYMSSIPPTVSVGLPASANARKYKNLISQFINGQITASEFQSAYIQAFKTSEDKLGQDEFDILQYLFTSADGYVADPESRKQLLAAYPELRKYGHGLDDEELRADAREAYRQLFGE